MTVQFWDRLALYVESVGVENAGVAWDLAHADMSDDDHLAFALMLRPEVGER